MFILWKRVESLSFMNEMDVFNGEKIDSSVIMAYAIIIAIIKISSQPSLGFEPVFYGKVQIAFIGWIFAGPKRYEPI